MPEEKALALLSEQGSNIRVRNVHTRIPFRFGKEYGMKINSSPGQGCYVVLILPKIGALPVQNP